MNITAVQFAQMERQMQLRYCEYLNQFLRQHSAPAVKPFSDTQLLNLISRAVPQAQSLGINTGWAVLLYVKIALLNGPAFGQEPKMRAYFESSNHMSADQKMQWVYSRMMEIFREALPQAR